MGTAAVENQQHLTVALNRFKHNTKVDFFPSKTYIYFLFWNLFIKIMRGTLPILLLSLVFFFFNNSFLINTMTITKTCYWLLSVTVQIQINTMKKCYYHLSATVQIHITAVIVHCTKYWAVIWHTVQYLNRLAFHNVNIMQASHQTHVFQTCTAINLNAPHH